MDLEFAAVLLKQLCSLGIISDDIVAKTLNNLEKYYSTK